MKASVMLEKKKEYGTILAFDVKVTQEAQKLADELGVKIFIAEIIYHLFDQFKAYIDNLKEERKREASEEAVFPCVLKIMPNCVYNKKDPILLGVDVLEGTVKVWTPICVPQKDFIEIGRIESIENNYKPVDYAKKGQKIIGSNPEEQQKMFGRHFKMEDELVSKISRSSLDALKENYKMCHIDVHEHITRPLPGVIFPKKIVTVGDLKPAPILWHEDTGKKPFDNIRHNNNNRHGKSSGRHFANPNRNKPPNRATPGQIPTGTSTTTRMPHIASFLTAYNREQTKTEPIIILTKQIMVNLATSS